MNPVRPLLFLTYRSVINAVKRAVTTPRRIISFLFIIGYYFMIFIRPALMNSGTGSIRVPNEVPGFDFPAIPAVDSVIFAIFCFLTLFMMLGLFAHQGAFKPADVDVLFATPISPRVILLFRVIRESLAAYLLPLFMAVIGLRPAKLGFEALIRKMPHPEYGQIALRMFTVSWIFVAIFWVCTGYAVSIISNRDDKLAKRVRQTANTFLTWATIGVALIIAYRVYQGINPNGLIDLAHWPILRATFFSASLATMMVMAPITGSWTMGLLGLGILVAASGLSLWVALQNSGFLYDQAATRGFNAIRARELQKSGDLYAIAADRARSGKLKIRKSRLNKVKAIGPAALIWRELILLSRGAAGPVILTGAVGVVVAACPAFMPLPQFEYVYLMILGFFGFSLLTSTMGQTQVGFVEMLRRVDLQKPMPFPFPTVVFVEVLAKALPGIAYVFLALIIDSIAKPSFFLAALGAFIAISFFSLVLSSVTFLITMLFPDYGDASQRPLRALTTLLSITICGVPSLGVYVGLALVHVPLVIAGLASAAISVGATLVLIGVAGRLYETYNPSE